MCAHLPSLRSPWPSASLIMLRLWRTKSGFQGAPHLRHPSGRYRAMTHCLTSPNPRLAVRWVTPTQTPLPLRCMPLRGINHYQRSLSISHVETIKILSVSAIHVSRLIRPARRSSSTTLRATSHNWRHSMLSCPACSSPRCLSSLMT
jgi:hypothetical protein